MCVNCGMSYCNCIKQQNPNSTIYDPVRGQYISPTADPMTKLPILNVNNPLGPFGAGKPPVR